jgi:hypothetical protein
MLPVYKESSKEQMEKFISNSMNQQQNVGWAFERINADSHAFPMKFVVVNDHSLKLSTIMPVAA